MLFLLWPVRQLILQQEEMRMSPVFTSRSIPFIAGGLVAAAAVLLYALSKVAIDEKLAKVVIFTAALVVVGFQIIIMLVLFRESPAYMEPVSGYSCTSYCFVRGRDRGGPDQHVRV